MKQKSLIILALLILSQENLFSQAAETISAEDSVMVLKRVYMYDFDRKDFDDIDEPYLEQLWFDSNEVAKSLFSKAILIANAPTYEKMMLASYFFHDSDPSKVQYVLNNCQSEKDTIAAFGIMSSYSIEYSHFNISVSTVKKYCPKCQYK